MRELTLDSQDRALRSSPLSRSVAVAALVAVLVTLISVPAHGGCGCEKPAPRPAQVRPSVTYAGMPVTLFGGGLSVGQSYRVAFTSGIDGTTVHVTGTAVWKRDLADRSVKTQLVVPLPRVPLGPVAISVTRATTGASVFAIADSDFTVAPDPVVLDPEADGDVDFAGFRAAVGRDGVVYTAIDISNATKPMVLDVQMKGLPLRFTKDDVVFFNTQGFVMQKLVGTDHEPIPGMSVKPARRPEVDSDVLHYSRHEFATYFLKHQERTSHALDAADAEWHQDGSPHIDHDHLIVAIMGRGNNGQPLSPGVTAESTFESRGTSLFSMGLTGKTSVTVKGSATRIDSYTRGTDVYGSAGDVFTNGTLTVDNYARIKGSAAAGAFAIYSGIITGTQTVIDTPVTFMEATIPADLPSLGSITLTGGYREIVGPGSFLVDAIDLSYGSHLYVDNSAGPVTLYVRGTVTVSDWSLVNVADADPEKFAVYVPGGQTVTINADSYFSGVIYAPSSLVRLTGVGGFFGAFVGDRVIVRGGSKVHYDNALLGQAQN